MILNNNKNIFVLAVLLISLNSSAQRKINLREYFFPQDQSEYSMFFTAENDSIIRQSRQITIIGKDTIRVDEYGSNKILFSSTTYVVSDSTIRIIQASNDINGKLYSSRIGLDTWAQTKNKRNKKVQLDIRTDEVCSNNNSSCYWSWYRLKQLKFKKGFTHIQNKKVKTIAFTFQKLYLSQPTMFSSIAGLSRENVTYVFAREIGLIKVIYNSTNPKRSNSLFLNIALNNPALPKPL